ncbi:hypothetical protein [uncultured Jatrophihabitans sp.]|uniref:aa3-type cytochrome oxidase subunit CtaJ n=1 Tax=uncultured Jatrophihabitans sp. TaxID=1610747 RepID=UPI0035C9E28A
MTIVQTLLVFVGIPAAIIALLALAVYGKTMVRQPTRYRPGKPWNFEPSWYVPHPDAVIDSPAGRQLEGAGSSTTATGGASGEW